MRGAIARRIAGAAWPTLYAAARKCERRSRDAAYASRLEAADRWWRVANWFQRKARAAERHARQG